VLGDEDPPVLGELRQDGEDLRVREMLQDVPNEAHVAVRQWVAHDVEAHEARRRIAVIALVPADERFDDVDADVARAQRQQILPTRKSPQPRSTNVRPRNPSLEAFSETAATNAATIWGSAEPDPEWNSPGSPPQAPVS
jgi:hypothetical protein